MHEDFYQASQVAFSVENYQLVCFVYLAMRYCWKQLNSTSMNRYNLGFFFFLKKQHVQISSFFFSYIKRVIPKQ